MIALNRSNIGLHNTGGQLYAVPVLMKDYVHTDGRSVNEGMMLLGCFV